MMSFAPLRELTQLRQGAVASWLLFIGGFILGAILGLVVSVSDTFTAGLFSLLGVALGGVISAIATLRSTREAQLAQIATATWPDRVKKHQEAYLWYHKMIMIHFDPIDERLKMSNEANTWLQKNYLYLSSNTREKLRKLFGHYLLPAGRLPSEVTRDDLEQIDPPDLKLVEDVYRSIIEGAGGHISDEIVQRSVSRDLMNARQSK